VKSFRYQSLILCRNVYGMTYVKTIYIPDLKQLKLYAISSPKLRPQEAGVLQNVTVRRLQRNFPPFMLYHVFKSPTISHPASFKYCPQPNNSHLKFSSIFYSHLILHLRVGLSVISSASLLQSKFEHQLRVPNRTEQVLCSVLGQDINYTV